jgi:DNA-directed RNA polymerase subunit alpha
VNRPEDAPIGLIPVDSIFAGAPGVLSVDPPAWARSLDYDKLLLTVETNGAVTPEDSVALAARILQDQLQLFINFDEPQQIRSEEPRDDLPFNRCFVAQGGRAGIVGAFGATA